ncbi:hypothetical protein [Leptolyngbya sp. KIOST-1]|nr:hypothetical protein [Leptolyngbya sp. KIOST-1]
MSELHRHLWTIAQQLPSDFEPHGDRDRHTDWSQPVPAATSISYP